MNKKNTILTKKIFFLNIFPILIYFYYHIIKYKKFLISVYIDNIASKNYYHTKIFLSFFFFINIIFYAILLLFLGIKKINFHDV
jgi:hypothetical protein